MILLIQVSFLDKKMQGYNYRCNDNWLEYRMKICVNQFMKIKMTILTHSMLFDKYRQ